MEGKNFSRDGASAVFGDSERYEVGVDCGDGESWSDVYYAKNTTRMSFSQVVTNIIMNGKVGHQDLNELARLGVPVLDNMLSSLNVGLFVKGIIEYELKLNKTINDYENGKNHD